MRGKRRDAWPRCIQPLCFVDWVIHAAHACRAMRKDARWELYKRGMVQQVLVDAGKADRLQQYSSLLFSRAWKP
jgi:hypothetical protein